MFLAQVKLREGLRFQVEVPQDNSDLPRSASARQRTLDSFYDD